MSAPCKHCGNAKSFHWPYRSMSENTPGHAYEPACEACGGSGTTSLPEKAYPDGVAVTTQPCPSCVVEGESGNG